MSLLAEDARTAAAAHGRQDLRQCDRAGLVDQLHLALGSDEVVQRFFIDVKIRRGALWVALTPHRLLLLEPERHSTALRSRTLLRPLQMRLNPKRAWPWAVEVVAVDGDSTTLVILEQGEVEALMDVESTGQFPCIPRESVDVSPTGVESADPEPDLEPAPVSEVAVQPAIRVSLQSRIRRTARGWFRIRPDPISDYWSDATKSWPVPAAVMAKFADAHPEVPPETLPVVAAALMQWLRVEGRHPGHAQPSVAVDSLWRLMAGEAEWVHFTETVGMDLPHRPMTPPPRDWYASKMAREGMQSTFADAVYDEQPL